MPFNVRVFGHKGTRDLKRLLPTQFSSDSVQQMDQPYAFSQVIEVGDAAVSSVADTGTGVQILRIEVPDGKSIRYEINPPTRGIAAGNQSPILSGHDQFAFADGWTVSMIDAAGLP